MGTTLEYSQLVTILSLVSVALFSLHLVRAIKMYQHHHDDRAAVTLVKAIGLLIISAGMLISSSGLLLDDAQFSIVGLSISRGALIMVAMTLIFADVKRAPDPIERIQP
jgi:hypothetical protein